MKPLGLALRPSALVSHLQEPPLQCHQGWMEPRGKGPFHLGLQIWTYVVSPGRFAELLTKSKRAPRRWLTPSLRFARGFRGPAPSPDVLRGPIPQGVLKTCRKNIPQPPYMGISPLQKKPRNLEMDGRDFLACTLPMQGCFLRWYQVPSPAPLGRAALPPSQPPSSLPATMSGPPRPRHRLLPSQGAWAGAAMGEAGASPPRSPAAPCSSPWCGLCPQPRVHSPFSSQHLYYQCSS